MTQALQRAQRVTLVQQAALAGLDENADIAGFIETGALAGVEVQTLKYDPALRSAMVHAFEGRASDGGSV